MAFARVGLVTGANKGIGFAIVRQLALHYPKSPLNNGPLLVYLTARDENSGKQTVASLEAEDRLRQARALQADGGLTSIRFHQLDISDPNSLSAFAAYLAKEHPDGIDFAINNAGIALDGFDLDVVNKTLAVNYHATLDATRAFIPLLKKPEGGRLVNVASTAGLLLQRYSQPIAQRFTGAKSVDDITALMNEFTDAVKRGKEEDEGWPSSAYMASKAGAIGMTMQIANELKRQGNDKVLVNACCPGSVLTHMNKRGHKTPDQGAQTPVMLAIADIGGKSGRFWRDEAELSWESGR